MIDVLTIAQSVAGSLSGTMEFTPEFTQGETVTKRIVVIPSGVTHTMLTRTTAETEAHVQVAIVKRTETDGIPALIGELLGIGRDMLGSTHGDAKCIAVDYPTLYDAAELREKKLFVGVCELTFKGE